MGENVITLPGELTSTQMVSFLVILYILVCLIKSNTFIMSLCSVTWVSVYALVCHHVPREALIYKLYLYNYYRGKPIFLKTLLHPPR